MTKRISLSKISTSHWPNRVDLSRRPIRFGVVDLPRSFAAARRPTVAFQGASLTYNITAEAGRIQYIHRVGPSMLRIVEPAYYLPYNR